MNIYENINKFAIINLSIAIILFIAAIIVDRLYLVDLHYQEIGWMKKM